MTGSVQRVIVVTGASRGIGKAIALSLCDAGALLYVGYRSGEAEAKAVVDQITVQGGSAKILQIDVANSASVKAAFDRVAEESGGVDVLVNNAGISIDGLMLRAKDDDWDAVVDTNLKGAFMCARAALKTMLRRPEGRIILSQTTIYLASSPKSNSAYLAIDEARALVERTGNLPVPLHLRNSPTKLMKDLNYGKNYKYSHDYPNHFVNQQFSPTELGALSIWKPQPNATEQKTADWLRSLWKNRF